jgi:hypothetical protein
MPAAFWIFLWLLAPQSALSSVQGVVVRAGTSQTLAGESVGLWPTTRTAKTDAAGRFLFPNVSPGQYAITVVHDGVKTQIPLVLTAAQRFESVTVEVKPAPAISGTVFDPNGERVAGARVQALRTVYSFSGPRVQSILSVVTDDLGEFRLFRLRPGEYYVSATLNDREQRIVTSGLRLTPNLSKPDNRFPSIFFGGGYTPYQSQKLRLVPDSDTAGVQIFLKEGPQLRISGELVTVPPGLCARMAVVPEGGLVNTETDFVENVCGSFQIRGLSPGTYSILAVGQGMASNVVRVALSNGDAEGVKVTMVNTADINGRVAGGTAPMPPVTRVTLSRSSRDVSQRIETPVAQDGTFLVRNVGPGEYDVFIEPLPEKSFIRAITYSARDALMTPIHVDAGVLGRLDIQLSSNSLTAEGIVVDRSSRPVPGAEVVLVPRGFRTRADRYLMATADGGGNFRVAGIPPENYVIFAFEDLEPQAYFAFANDSALLARYTARGQILDAAGVSQQLRLIAIPATDTAGGVR